MPRSFLITLILAVMVRTTESAKGPSKNSSMRKPKGHVRTGTESLRLGGNKNKKDKKVPGPPPPSISIPAQAPKKKAGGTSQASTPQFNSASAFDAVFNSTVSASNVTSDLNTTMGIFIKLTDGLTSCISYNISDPAAVVEVTDCEQAGETALWEVVESESPILFQLRHLDSQLCIPENPQSPDQPFNCWVYDKTQAIGDTINGLVDCSSPYAAFVGFIDFNNPSFLYNAVCSTGEIGAETDVVLMAYTHDNFTQVLWGEKLLLDIPKSENPYDLNGNWVFEQVPV